MRHFYIPMWAIAAYFIVLGLVLVVIAPAADRARRRREAIRHASRSGLWSGGGRSAGPVPSPRSIAAAAGAGPVRPDGPAPAEPLSPDDTAPIARPTDTVPVPMLTGDVVRPYAAGIPVPASPVGRTNGHIVVCPLCGGGRLAGRVLLPSRPDCVWCGKQDGGVL